MKARWFDLMYVHVTRPFTLDDVTRYATFFEACDLVTGPFEGSTEISLGEVTGGIDKWVPRWRVRQYERAGWRRR